MDPDVQSGPFGVRALLQVLDPRARVGVALAAVLLVGLLLTFGSGRLRPPGFYRPPPLTAEQLSTSWCADGSLAHTVGGFYCFLDVPDESGREVWGPLDLQQYAAMQPPRPLRPRPVHPWTWAALVGLLGVAVWRYSRPVPVEINSHEVRIGEQRISRYRIVGCEVGRRLLRPTLVIHTRDTTFVSPPFNRSGWSVELLCNEIRALIVAPSEVSQDAEAEAAVRERLQAIRARRRASSQT